MKKVTRTENEFFTPEQVKLIDGMLKGAPQHEIERFRIVCERTGLDPFSRQIYARVQNRNVKKGDKWEKVPEVVIITSIDGLRSIAERSCEYRGQTAPEWYYLNDDTGKPGWYDVCIIKRDPKGNPLTIIDSCRVGVKRKDFDAPVYGIANYASFAVYEKDGEKWVPSLFWKKMPEHMIAKVAEAQALRKAFPALAQGLYIEEEIKDPEADEHIPEGRKPEALPEGMAYVPEHAGGKVQPKPEEKITAATAGAASKPKEEPKPAPAKPQEQSEDQSPFGEYPEPTSPPADKPAPNVDDSWKNHKITTITISRFNGRLLSDLSAAELKDLHDGWVVKFADKIAKNPEKVKEAAAITAGFKATQ